MKKEIDVIATTVSGSISDWAKVERIRPLFEERGFPGTRLHVAKSHGEARTFARDLLRNDNRRLLISAGGSGTFNAVLEGCCDSGIPLGEIDLGFLRKGSADLLGKVLGMPDDIVKAADVFSEAIRSGYVMPCDVLAARDETGETPARHFVGYGGAEIFGRIPHFTENRFMKWYKGVLSQFFGDLGPFTLGMTLALLEKTLKGPFGRRQWRIVVDGREAGSGRYQALIIVNGYLGPDMPYSDDTLGSGRFHLFALRDLGALRLPGQARRARDGSIMEEPGRWGMDHFTIHDTLILDLDGGGVFPLNVDGSTLLCRNAARIDRVGKVRLIACLPESPAPD